MLDLGIALVIFPIAFLYLQRRSPRPRTSDDEIREGLRHLRDM